MHNSEEFDKIASDIFFPIYEVIAKEALNVFGNKDGNCLDIGCGGGHLGISVAKESNMRVTLMDINENAIKIAGNRVKDLVLEDRTSAIVGDVRKINQPDNCFNLIVSRSSIGFWGNRDDMKQAFAEIYRVLAPNGTTYIGRGFGDAELGRIITAKMKSLDPEWPQCVKAASNGFDAGDYADFLNELKIEAGIIDDDRGLWIMMKKPG